jgi:hypothetical protein
MAATGVAAGSTGLMACSNARRRLNTGSSAWGIFSMPRVSQNKESTPPAFVGWRPAAWRAAFNPPISKSQVALWISDGTLPSSKPGGIRLITISPAEFVERNRVAAGK